MDTTELNFQSVVPSGEYWLALYTQLGHHHTSIAVQVEAGTSFEILAWILLAFSHKASPVLPIERKVCIYHRPDDPESTIAFRLQ